MTYRYTFNFDWIPPVSGVGGGGSGVEAHTQNFLIFQKFVQKLKQFEQKISTFFAVTISMTFYFFFVECENKGLMCDRNTLNVYNIDELFLVTPCFVCESLWVTDSLESLGKKGISFMCFIKCTLIESSTLQGN